VFQGMFGVCRLCKLRALPSGILFHLMALSRLECLDRVALRKHMHRGGIRCHDSAHFILVVQPPCKPSIFDNRLRHTPDPSLTHWVILGEILVRLVSLRVPSDHPSPSPAPPPPSACSCMNVSSPRTPRKMAYQWAFAADGHHAGCAVLHPAGGHLYHGGGRGGRHLPAARPGQTQIQGTELFAPGRLLLLWIWWNRRQIMT